MITEKSIIDAWVFLRTNNNSIPDNVLDFIKDSSLAALRQQNLQQTQYSTLLELLIQMMSEEQRLYDVSDNDSVKYGTCLNMGAIHTVMELIIKRVANCHPKLLMK